MTDSRLSDARAQDAGLDQPSTSRSAAPSELMESIAFARALGLRWQETRDGEVALRLPFSPAVSEAGPHTPMDPRALFTLFDHACGGAVHRLLGPSEPTATLDLRVDYLRAAPAATPVIVRCSGLARDQASVTVQGFAFFGDDPHPFAVALGRFIVGSAPGRSHEGPDGFARPNIASGQTLRAVEAQREAFENFTQTLGLEAVPGDPASADVQFPPLARLVGAPMLPALHGGAVGALLMAATDRQMGLAQEQIKREERQVLASVTVRYLRASRLALTRARPSIDKAGARATFASAVALQDDGTRLTATAQMIYLKDHGRS